MELMGHGTIRSDEWERSEEQAEADSESGHHFPYRLARQRKTFEPSSQQMDTRLGPTSRWHVRMVQ
jgi:hypothetical protein